VTLRRGYAHEFFTWWHTPWSVRLLSLLSNSVALLIALQAIPALMDGRPLATAVALLAGGAVKGGRVIAEWPGVRAASLFEGRDLRPTTDLRAVLKGLLRDHLRVEERALASAVFPGSEAVKGTSGLVTVA